MSALPANWEWDYDGTRWFYRYKPNGHVQFHFPKEGDEFPDFIDIMSPIPDLAPEERLESQQQLKRRTGVDVDSKSKMRATGGPLDDFGMNRSGFGGPLTDEEDGFLYQPENFMYLGPGAYTDVSPLADEEERDHIANSRRKNKSNGDEGKDKTMLDAAGTDKAGVSPLQSATNTPSVVHSTPVRESVAVPQPVAEDAVLVISTQELPGPTQPAIPSPGVPLLDSVEKPRPGSHAPAQSAPWDPVGVVAEMATEHTAAARIETHPDPVEIGDSAVLAPIETQMMNLGIAELPERTSPSDARPPVSSTHDLLHQTNMTDQALHGATFGSGSRPQSSSPTTSAQPNTEARPVNTPAKVLSHQTIPETAPQPPSSSQASPAAPFSIKRKPSKTAAKQGQYQPYVPGSAPTITSEQQNRSPDFKPRGYRNPLAREASLMLGTRQTYEASNVPSVLQPPKVPPKHPLDSTQPSGQHPVNPARPDNTRTQTEPAGVFLVATGTHENHTQAPLQHVPSVLKPARGYPQGKPQESAYQSNQVCQPIGTQPSGQIPHSLAPARGQPQSSGIRPGVHRVETAPELPPSDHHSPSSHLPLQNAGPQTCSRPPVPQFLQRPRGQSNLDRNPPKPSYAPFPSTATRVRSSSDAPKPFRATPSPPASSARGQLPPRPGTAFKETPEPNTDSKRESAMDFMRGYFQPGTDGATQRSNNISPTNRTRQISYADSEVSSLGPPSEGQSSGQILQTPSPLETGGRRSSSGFFRGTGANAFPEGSGASIAAPRQSPFNDHNDPIQSPGSRPASFSGPSPTSTQPTTPGSAGFDTIQTPPVIPGKVPIYPSIGVEPLMAPINRTIQSVVGGDVSPTGRRHSVPIEQVTPLVERAAVGQSQMYLNGDSSLASQIQKQSFEHGRGIPRPHSAQSNTSQPASRQAEPPYPVEASQDMPRQPIDRPQRPTVTPPTQQFFGPMSPRTPGHTLHPIQEHADGDRSTRSPVTAVPRDAHEPRRRSPGTARQMSTGSSQYPSSAESPNEQSISITGSQVPGSGPQSQPMSPAMPTAGQKYSPVQNNPFQQSPINLTGYPTHQVTHPDSISSAVAQSAKDTEKGGWLSKFMRGPGKPHVLQKPQPSQQAVPTAPQSPNTVPPAQGVQWPPLPSALNTGLPFQHQQFQQQQASQSIINHQAPAISKQVRPPVHEPKASETQIMPNEMMPLQPADSVSRTEPEQSAMALGPQGALKPQARQSPAMGQGTGQTSRSISPRERSPAPGPTSEQIADNMSDAASVSALSVSTMDVSEAQAQPVLKPHLVTVEKTSRPHGQDQLPSRIAMTQNLSSSPSLPKANQRSHEMNLPTDNELAVAPLFSKTQAKTAVPPASVNKAPAANDKWAKKPVVDYSGDDWGDDPWDYQ